jgi:hypothetical protein
LIPEKATLCACIAALAGSKPGLAAQSNRSPHLPKYFFNVYRSREPPRIDEEGQRFTDEPSACREAIKVAADSVADLKNKFQIGDEWRLEVTSDMQKEPLYVIRFSLERTS